MTEERQPRENTRASHGKIAANTGTSRFGVLADLGEQEGELSNGNTELHQPHKDPILRGEDSGRFNTGVKQMRRKGGASLIGLEGELNMGLGLGKNATVKRMRKKGGENLNGLEGELCMGLGLGKNAAVEGGSNLGGSPSNMDHDNSV